MNYYFELRKDKQDKNNLAPIRLVVKHNNIRIRKSINAKSKIKDWDKESHHINNPKKSPLYQTYKVYNSSINSAKEKIEKIFNFFEYNNIPFSRKVFLEKYESSDINVAIKFFDAFDEYIEVSKLTKVNSTIIKIKSVKNFLMSFQEHSSYTLRLDNINFRFEESFMDYCFNTRKTLNNYYAKILKTLKAFLNWAYERKYHNSLEFKKIKSKENDIEVIYLTLDELNKLSNYKFSNPAKDRARDMFCFLAYTGQRHVDIYSLSETNINEDYLNFTVKKTKTIGHQVYLIKQAKEIIEKYKNTVYFPVPRITSQKLNEKIQECCEDVGITQKITLTRYMGAKQISQSFRKCDLITSHVARKTFITNSLCLGIPERVVRNISNHKDEKNFRKYVKVSKKQKQKELDRWNSIF